MDLEVKERMQRFFFSKKKIVVSEKHVRAVHRTRNQIGVALTHQSSAWWHKLAFCDHSTARYGDRCPYRCSPASIMYYSVVTSYFELQQLTGNCSEEEVSRYVCHFTQRI